MKTKFMIVDDVKTRFIDLGEGPCVIFVHGLGGSLETWSSNLLELSKQYRVVSLDLVGHGSSEKPLDKPYTVNYYVNFLMRFIQYFELDNYSLVCSSFGGLISLVMCLMRPDNISKLVLVDSLGIKTADSAWKRRFTSILSMINLMRFFHSSQKELNIVTEDKIRRSLEDNVFYDPKKIPDFIIQNAINSANSKERLQ